MSDIAVFFKVGGGFKSRMTETTYVWPSAGCDDPSIAIDGIVHRYLK